MLKKRIIPCLDIQNARVVKGVKFENLTDQGDPVALAEYYVQQQADELVFLDISASHERRKTMLSWARSVAEVLNIPFTVGGGISEIAHAEALLKIGADKVSINTSAVQNPELITQLAERFGSQAVVVAIDTRHEAGKDYVFTHGGRTNTYRETLAWAYEAQERGAGEILLTSMDHDGTRNGFALCITQLVAEKLTIPIIASGGAGNRQHFLELFQNTHASAALAASIFHQNVVPIPQLKAFLNQHHIPVRTYANANP